MNIVFTRSFERTLKDSEDKEAIKKAADRVLEAFEHGRKPEGLGLKKMRGEIWEVRAGLRTRLLFAVGAGELKFLIVGDHEDIRRYLKG